jgi:hypothetical protein
MSLCLFVLHKNALMMSADSRGSYHTGTERFAVTDDCQKIYKVGDKVIFTSGISNLMISIIKNYEMAKDQSINSLADISRKVYDVWKILNPDMQHCGNGRAVELVIGTAENKKCVAYTISSYDNDFKPQRYEGNNNFTSATLGSHGTEALSDLSYCVNKDIRKYVKGKTVNFHKMFLDIYSKYPDEEMGGYLHFYSISPNGIFKKEPVIIPDIREINRIDLTKEAHLNPKTGFQIDKNVGTYDDPVWDNVVYIDNTGNAVFAGRLEAATGVFHGTLEAGNITSGLITGGFLI